MEPELNPVLKALAWDDLVKRATTPCERGVLCPYHTRLRREIEHLTKKYRDMADGQHWRK